MQYQLLLQTLIVPFLLSSLGHKFISNRYALFSILIVWFVSFSWILGRFPIVLEEPVEQVWLLFSVGVIAGFYIPKRPYPYFLIAIYLTSLLMVSWPVLKYSIELSFVLEFSVFAITGILISFIAIDNKRPALSTSISLMFLGIVIALTGSLLIGQISMSLSSVIGIFALIEIKSRLKEKHLSGKGLRLFGLMFLLILYLSRLYAELDIYVTYLLIVAMLQAILSKKHIALLLSVAIYIAVIILAISNDSAGSYY